MSDAAPTTSGNGRRRHRQRVAAKVARLQSLPVLCVVLMFFDCFDVPTHRALVGDQFRQTTDPRHAADGGQPFTVASAVVGQFLKFG